MTTNSQTWDDILLRAAAWHVAKEEVREKVDVLADVVSNVAVVCCEDGKKQPAEVCFAEGAAAARRRSDRLL